uniref:Homeobox domain-containing protein n=1 Tax=Chenopodium quinoa TaxID=63459 RepID=A0A803L8B7_CHEQI
MAEFTSSGKFGNASIPKQMIEENQVFSYQSSVNEPIVAELQMGNQTDTIANEKPVVELSKNEIGSIGNQLGEPVQMSNVVSDKIPLEGVDVSLRVEQESENQREGGHDSVKCEQPGLKERDDSEAGPDSVKAEQNAESKDDTNVLFEMEGVQISLAEDEENLISDMLKSSGKTEPNEFDACDAEVIPNAQTSPLGVACDTEVTPNVHSTPSPEKAGDKVRIVVLAAPAYDANEKPIRGRRSKAVVASEKKTPRQLSAASKRDLRSRSNVNSKDPEPSIIVETTKGSTGRRGRKKGKGNDGKSDDAFSKMRKHLRYLLHRIHYEQNLLDAYSSEGWRGQSVEKLRPEKELQRAKADINRSKLKIRDLFQRFDSMLAEGKFPETLYDADGLIDSEDIFCAKCASKDLSPGNDIILCDVPPGDEGWLCPACDCKLDCVDLLNDSQGTRLAIEDKWEKVFPEAVSAMVSKELDDVMGLPSDDSEDNEYNPDGTDDDANAEGNESSSATSDSDESEDDDFSSVSEDLGPIRGAEQNLGLPSDDSEDDDFNPDAANVNEEGVEPESSSSDFTSASEDLGAAIGDDGTSDINEPSLPLDPEQDLGESSPITSKRCVQRLDYKKLYDETYGNAASDPSDDDEEWTDVVGTRKRKSSQEKAVSVSNMGTSASADGTCGVGSSRRRGRPKASRQAANGSPVPLQESPQKKSPAGSSKRRPPYNRLGEAVTKRLYESFKENQYPDREAKEKLANELGLTAYKVDKWFGNARWSFHHHPSRLEANMTRVVSNSSTHSGACIGGESALADTITAVPECGSADISALDVASGKISSPPKSGMKVEGNKSMLETSKAEVSKEGTQTESLEIAETSQGKLPRKRRKSGA